MCEMPKIAIIGAGSVGFGQTLICDILQRPAIEDVHFHLMDIDADRLAIAEIAAARAITTLGVSATVQATGAQRDAVADAEYVINCVQVGGSEATKLDFSIPARYGLRQTIGDTLGIGGIFRALRTYPMLMELAGDIATVGAPRCQLLNYTNPMAMNMLAVLRAQDIQAVGLCHSVQGSSALLAALAGVPVEEVRFRCAGINHMAFFTELRAGDRDLYPVLFDRLERDSDGLGRRVRMEMMRRTGYFVTESSEHQSEYSPYFLHHGDEVVARYRVPLDELLRRDRATIERWHGQRDFYTAADRELEMPPVSHEYGSQIIEAMEADVPTTIYGNVLNHGLIENLSEESCVEVACHVDGNGVRPLRFGRLPTVLAGIIGSNIAVQLATVEAAESGRREAVYHAAMLDPHTAATLTLDQIWEMCDELIAAHSELLPPLASVQAGTGSNASSHETTKAEVSVVPRSLPPEEGDVWPVTVRGHNLTTQPLSLQLAVGAAGNTEAVRLELPSAGDAEVAVNAVVQRNGGGIAVEAVYYGTEPVLVRSLRWPDRPTVIVTEDTPIRLPAEQSEGDLLSVRLTREAQHLNFEVAVADCDPRLYRECVDVGSAVTFTFSVDGICVRQFVVAPDLTSGEVVVESDGHPGPRASTFSCQTAPKGQPGYLMRARFALDDLGADASDRGVLLFNTAAHLVDTAEEGSHVSRALYGPPETAPASFAALSLT